MQDAAPAQDKHAAVVRRVKPSDDDDYDFEDIETTKLRHGIKPRQKKVVVGHSWGQIAVGTALSCGQMGCFGALMGLSVGAITGACWACRYLFAASEHARACAGVRWICRWFGTGPLKLGRYPRPNVRAGRTPLACHHRAYEKAVPVVR